MTHPATLPILTLSEKDALIGMLTPRAAYRQCPEAR